MLPLFAAWPQLTGRLDHVALGSFPTPVERWRGLEEELGAGPLLVKRDDLSSDRYGGNKVRTLEVLFAQARAQGARDIFAMGAYGSNHAVATMLHARAAGLTPGAVLFPQPPSWAALDNLRVTAAHAAELHAPAHWSLLPLAALRVRAKDRVLMAPGGATPLGALGYVAAALELGAQVARKELAAPERIYVGVGSACTTAGLLVGLVHAARAKLGFERPPTLVAVRVTPWPVTSRSRILWLAAGASELLARLCEDPSLRVSKTELSRVLYIDGSELGAGYGRSSPSGEAVSRLFAAVGPLALDSTYSAKAAAAFVAAVRGGHRDGPSLFWSTKSTCALPLVSPEALLTAPRRVQRWLARTERELAPQRRTG